MDGTERLYVCAHQRSHWELKGTYFATQGRKICLLNEAKLLFSSAE